MYRSNNIFSVSIHSNCAVYSLIKVQIFWGQNTNKKSLLYIKYDILYRILWYQHFISRSINHHYLNHYVQICNYMSNCCLGDTNIIAVILIRALTNELIQIVVAAEHFNSVFHYSSVLTHANQFSCEYFLHQVSTLFPQRQGKVLY